MYMTIYLFSVILQKRMTTRFHKPLQLSSLVACRPGVDVFVGQYRHESCPTIAWNVPIGHASHCSDTTLKNVPTGHLAGKINMCLKSF
jgi:hypothetical protein